MNNFRIKVTIKDRSYDISCGNGIQDVAWLALSAAYLYGKEAYPRGFHQPTLLMRTDRELLRVPHPRQRINYALKDCPEVTVILKEPNMTQSKQQLKWYRRAFGDHRNLMKFVISYKPRQIDFSQGVRQNSIIIAKFNYKMNPELVTEFQESKYPSTISLELRAVDRVRKEFKGKIMLPFGEYKKSKVFEIVPNQREGAETQEPRELPIEEQLGVNDLPIPFPWSKSQQKQAMINEEVEHKKREEEAIKKAHEQSSKLDSNPLIPAKSMYDVWPDAPSALVPHFPLLFEIFNIYANFHLPEEDMISAHDFFHFIRAFDLVSSSEDLMQKIIELRDDIDSAKNEIVKARISLSHFLVLLVKFAEIRNPEDTGFANLMETIGKSKAIWLQDFIKSEMVKPQLSEIFMENVEELSAKYLAEASPAEGIVRNLSIQSFFNMVASHKELREVVNYDKVKQICEDTLFFSSFKDYQMLYVDFLENLVRLAQSSPFDEEEIMQKFANESETVILAEKLQSVVSILLKSEQQESGGSRGYSRGK